jgi:nucleoside-diphosphate-sugar epimerase
MDHDNVLVLVSGGTGFIGSLVVRELLRRGIRVRVMVRNSSVQVCGKDCTAELVPGDIRDPLLVRNAMQGVTHVIHAAACVARWTENPSVMYDVNVGGTRTILRAAEDRGVTAVVHMSSASAIVFCGSGVLDERAIAMRTVHLTDYGKSKALAEAEVMNMVAHGGNAVIVYPTRVFGTGQLDDSNAATRFLRLYLRGCLPVLPGGGNDFANWAFVADVARGVVQALFHGRRGERYILGGENARLRDFFAMADAIAGLKHQAVPIPHQLGRALASGEELRARVLHSHPRLTRAWYDAVFESVQLSCAHAIADLGYSIAPLREALSEVVPWLLQRQGSSRSGLRGE